MAEEVNNTENTENGNVQQDTNTGAAKITVDGLAGAQTIRACYTLLSK